jgi:glutamate-1-semialdehyde 2,1-aminomutase
MNDLEYTGGLLSRNRDELAAVIVEPMMGAAGAIAAEPDFLQGLRRATEQSGILLIFDEVITFRLGHGGAQEHLGVRPDLTTFGKIIGGGLPVGAFGGRTDVMATFDPTRAGPIVHSGTYNGNAVTMAAGIATLELFTAEAIDGLNRMGDELRARLNALLAERDVAAQVVGRGSVMQLHFMTEPIQGPRDAARADARALRLMHLAMLARGKYYAEHLPNARLEVLDCGHMLPFEKTAEFAERTIAFLT